jgi:hypothetical protein
MTAVAAVAAVAGIALMLDAVVIAFFVCRKLPAPPADTRNADGAQNHVESETHAPAAAGSVFERGLK